MVGFLETGLPVVGPLGRWRTTRRDKNQLEHHILQCWGSRCRLIP